MRYLLLLLFCAVSQGQVEHDIRYLEKAADLLLTFSMNRHGERAPLSGTRALSDDPERDDRLSFPFGEGGLTLGGKMRGYNVGKYIRQRYGHLLSDLYFKDEIYLRSTDVDRTKMTLLAALAAIYPPGKDQQWKSDLNWQPIPYKTYPVPEDYLMYFINCKRVTVMDYLEVPNPDMTAEFYDLMQTLTNHLPCNFTETPIMVLTYYDLLLSQAAIGVPLPEWTLPHLDRMYEASCYATKFMLNDDLTKRLTGGVFLNEFIENANAIISGKDVKQRVHLYSVHDMNIAAELAAGRLPVIAPKYGAVLSFELHQMKRSGQYVVVPVYLPQAGASTPRILPIEGCSFPCDFKRYRELVSPYTLTKEQQEKESGISSTSWCFDCQNCSDRMLQFSL